MRQNFPASVKLVLRSEGGFVSGSQSFTNDGSCSVCVDSAPLHRRPKPSIRNTSTGSEVFKDHRLPCINYQHIVRPCPSLLRGSGPPTISGLVISVDINSIKRPPGWALSHVVKECVETRGPLLAHCDASAAINGKLRVIRVKATAFCVRVGLESPRHLPANLVPMRNRSVTRCFNPQATTTARVSASDWFKKTLNFVATIAPKQPHRSAASIWSPAERHEPAIPLSRNINFCNHLSPVAQQS